MHPLSTWSSSPARGHGDGPRAVAQRRRPRAPALDGAPSGSAHDGRAAPQPKYFAPRVQLPEVDRTRPSSECCLGRLHPAARAVAQAFLTLPLTQSCPRLSFGESGASSSSGSGSVGSQQSRSPFGQHFPVAPGTAIVPGGQHATPLPLVPGAKVVRLSGQQVPLTQRPLLFGQHFPSLHLFGHSSTQALLMLPPHRVPGLQPDDGLRVDAALFPDVQADVAALAVRAQRRGWRACQRRTVRGAGSEARKHGHDECASEHAQHPPSWHRSWRACARDRRTGCSQCNSFPYVIDARARA